MKSLVIVFGHLKGGVRKTTSAMFTAFALRRLGFSVGLIDGDPGTQSASDWISRLCSAGIELPFWVWQWSPGLGMPLVPFVQAKARESDVDVIVGDIGDQPPNALSEISHLADMIIVPTGAEQAEVARIGTTAAVVRSARPDADLSILLTRVPRPGLGSAKVLREALTASGYVVLPWEIPQDRERYAHTYGTVPIDLGPYAELAAYVTARREVRT